MAKLMDNFLAIFLNLSIIRPIVQTTPRSFNAFSWNQLKITVTLHQKINSYDSFHNAFSLVFKVD
jgi:hypothetical protein